jgi:hypothetical protein
VSELAQEIKNNDEGEVSEFRKDEDKGEVTMMENQFGKRVNAIISERVEIE